MDVHSTIGRNVRALRKRQAIGHEEFAEIMTVLGFPMSPPTLSRLETGHRGIKVDELLALAFALRTSPFALVMPEPTETVTFGEGGNVEVDADTLGNWWFHMGHPREDTPADVVEQSRVMPTPSVLDDIFRRGEEVNALMGVLGEALRALPAEHVEAMRDAVASQEAATDHEEQADA